jgi:serine/threonine protein kinase
MLGKLLDKRYQISQLLGEGGFGQTFVAEDTKMFDAKCVVKALKPAARDAQTVELAQKLFLKEARLLHELGNHDRIPRLFASFEEEGDFYLVQEYIQGYPLNQELIPNLQMSERDVICLVNDILQPLVYVHQHNVIHRDIKPPNLMRRVDDSKIVLIDFGSVKQIHTQIVEPDGQTKMTVAIGTYGYMPTEQGAGTPELSSDLYAVGMIAIQALTGIIPHKLSRNSDREICWRDRVDSTSEFADFLDKMIRYDCRQRYQSATEALAALEQIIDNNAATPIKSSNSAQELKIPNPSEDRGYTPTVVVENNTSKKTQKEVDSKQTIDILKSPKLRYLASQKSRSGGVVGISIGLSNSTAAIYKDSQIIKLANISSTVNYTAEGSCFAGNDKIEHLPSNVLANIFENFIYFIGRTYDESVDLISQVPYKVAKGSKDRIILECSALNKWFSPEELLTELLCEILNRCEDELNIHITQVVITVPAFLNNILCRESIKSSAEAAGIQVFRILDEALAYGLGGNLANGYLRPDNRTCLVIVADDFYIAGCVLELGGGLVEVLTNFLRYVAPGTFSKPEGEQLVIEAIDDMLRLARINIDRVDVTVLPVKLSKLAAMKAIYYLSLADETKEIIWSKNVTADGAALEAGILAGEVKDILLLDVTLLALGVWTKQGLTKVLLSNTTIPTKKCKLFSCHGGSSQITIPIVEGESDRDRENSIIGIIYFDVDPTHKLSIIELSFDLDHNNILNVTAVNKIDGKSKSLTVLGRKLLSPEETIRLYDDRSLLIRSIEGQAIWHGPGADTTVEIEGFMGVKNDDVYLKIKDSETGIKLSDVEFIDSSA